MNPAHCLCPIRRDVMVVLIHTKHILIAACFNHVMGEHSAIAGPFQTLKGRSWQDESNGNPLRPRWLNVIISITPGNRHGAFPQA